MTTAKNNELMGYDPLAWMDEEQQVQHGADKKPADRDDASLPSATSMKASEQQPSKLSEAAETPVVLPATLNIQGVALLHEQLQAALQSRKQVIIDAQHVNSIDTAALQLLVIFRREALQSNMDICINAPTEQFVAAAQILDVADLLEVA